MPGFRAAKRYAKGLMDFAIESNQTKRINEEMSSLKQIISDSRDLSNFLSTPILDTKRKSEIAVEIFKSFSKTTQNFIQLVIKQGRGSLLEKIAIQYNRLYNQQNNISTAEVTSAVSLNKEMLEQIVNLAKQRFNSNAEFEIENKVNPDLLGGFVLKVGDKQIDSSLRSRLNRLKKEFNKNEYIPKF